MNLVSRALRWNASIGRKGRTWSYFSCLCSADESRNLRFVSASAGIFIVQIKLNSPLRRFPCRLFFLFSLYLFGTKINFNSIHSNKTFNLNGFKFRRYTLCNNDEARRARATIDWYLYVYLSDILLLFLLFEGNIDLSRTIRYLLFH